MPAMEPMLIFDRAAVRAYRRRAARAPAGSDFLIREVAARLADRLADISRPFAAVLDLGGQALLPALRCGPGGDVEAEEDALPFAPASFDLVISNLTLHQVNDLPGALLQVRQCLRPDGLFLAAMLGGDTLAELRQAMVEAETAEAGGASPRVAPMADLRDAAGLLQRAGFALPVADADRITVTYPDALALMRDLRHMGQANALAGRLRRFTRRGVLARAAAIYADRHAGPDGRIPACFQVLHLAGWAPHASQQKPLRPGSAAHSLAAALKG